MLQCKECGKSKDLLTDTGICMECLNDDEIEDIVQIKLPDGLVGFWIDSSSYISKKTGQRYFKIPDGLKKNIIHGKDYKIIITEV